MSAPNRILIAGVGNILLSDDGVGVHVVQALRQDPIPGVVMADIGTAILHGLHFLESADRVLVIDAARGGQPPGTLYLFEPGKGAQGRAVHSIHALGLHEASAFLLAGKSAPAITVLGVEPGSLGYGMNLSGALRAVLPRILALVRETVSGWKRVNRWDEDDHPVPRVREMNVRAA